MMPIEPVTLTGHLVRLEPLQMKHASDLYEMGADPSLWRYRPIKPPATLTDWEAVIATMQQKQEKGTCLPFAIIDLASNRAVGETRYMSIVREDYGLEIGGTWLTPTLQRTGVNTECKYLLLCHAFDVWGAIRMQFKTHHLNLASQRAIERLGAVKEGVLRNHMIMLDGSYRHSVYYSIIASEWPEVKERLEAKMRR